jgi:hypothetical protein
LLQLGDAFDKIGEKTSMALCLYTADKCEQLGQSFAVAEGMRSAFKLYFERCVLCSLFFVPLYDYPLIFLLSVHGCQGEYWHFNPHTGKWKGNPVFENDYKAYYKSLKNRTKWTETATQALPMLPKDLEIIFGFLNTEAVVEKFLLMQRLYFKAFATIAFILWTQ